MKKSIWFIPLLIIPSLSFGVAETLRQATTSSSTEVEVALPSTHGSKTLNIYSAHQLVTVILDRNGLPTMVVMDDIETPYSHQLNNGSITEFVNGEKIPEMLSTTHTNFFKPTPFSTDSDDEGIGGCTSGEDRDEDEVIKISQCDITNELLANLRNISVFRVNNETWNILNKREKKEEKIGSHMMGYVPLNG